MKPLIVANWKCNPVTLKRAEQVFVLVKKNIKNIKNIEIVVCPPFVYLPKFKAQSLKFKLGAQDVFWQGRGAFTGEISPKMLKDLGVEYIILGHSERRQILKETDEMINNKLKAVLGAGLKPILCIGETQEEKKEGITKRVIRRQLEKDLKEIQNSKFKIQNLIIAYEPIWAIGTGKSCLPQEALKAKVFISNVLKVLFGKKIAEKIRILYGGNVSSKNGLFYIKEAKMDGLLVGGISLKPKEFIKLLQTCKLF